MCWDDCLLRGNFVSDLVPGRNRFLLDVGWIMLILQSKFVRIGESIAAHNFGVNTPKLFYTESGAQPAFVRSQANIN